MELLSLNTVATLLAFAVLILLLLWWQQEMRGRWRRHPGPWRRRVATSAIEASDPTSRRKPEWVRQRVLRLAVHLHSCRAIAAHFNRSHGHLATIGKTWVNELCREHSDEIQRLRREMKQRSPLPLPPNVCWGLDLTTISSPGGHRMTVFGLLDHGSRRMLRLQSLPRKCTWTLLAQLCHAVALYGKPGAIRTDNEGMFRSKLWRNALRVVGVRHELTEVGCPWQNGRIERFFGTLKPLLRTVRPPTSGTLQRVLNEFGWFYNHVRVHQHLQGRTPMEAWHGVSAQDLKRRIGEGLWVSALNGQLKGFLLKH